MCCFSRAIQSVSNTNIFARFATKGEQYLVYSMMMKASERLAMILPIPVRQGSDENAVSFVNLQEYPHFFDDMSQGFPQPRAGGRTLSAPDKKAKLEVVNVGSFEASFVPTVSDFDRLDERFRLPEGTWDKLPQYKEYGFAVFKLKEGEQNVHPMAFRFPTARTDKLFFPTVHIHDGKIYRTAEFDHTLYCQLSAGDTAYFVRWKESPQPASMFMNTKKSVGLVEPDKHCYRRVIKGRKNNADMWV